MVESTSGISSGKGRKIMLKNTRKIRFEIASQLLCLSSILSTPVHSGVFSLQYKSTHALINSSINIYLMSAEK